MKILVTGARGMLGKDLTGKLQGTCELWIRDIDDLDITDKNKVLIEILNIKPDVIINCAAYTNVDKCETDQDTAFAINADGVKNLALACKEAGSVLYHISTDFVFDGKKKEPYKETDSVNPLSIYGKSKLAGEQYIQSILTEYAIFRTSWLFGCYGKNFVSTILNLSDEKDEIQVVNDQSGCPTFTVDLAEVIIRMLDRQSRGIYHVCNSGICSWYDFAVKIIELSERNTKIIPITTQQLKRPASRPQFSALDCTKLIAETGKHPRKWIDALKEYLNN